MISSRGLVAPALPFLDPLRLCGTLHLGVEPKLEAHDLCRRLDARQCPRSRRHLWKGVFFLRILAVS